MVKDVERRSEKRSAVTGTTTPSMVTTRLVRSVTGSRPRISTVSESPPDGKTRKPRTQLGQHRTRQSEMVQRMLPAADTKSGASFSAHRTLHEHRGSHSTREGRTPRVPGVSVSLMLTTAGGAQFTSTVAYRVQSPTQGLDSEAGERLGRAESEGGRASRSHQRKFDAEGCLVAGPRHNLFEGAERFRGVRLGGKDANEGTRARERNSRHGARKTAKHVRERTRGQVQGTRRVQGKRRGRTGERRREDGWECGDGTESLGTVPMGSGSTPEIVSTQSSSVCAVSGGSAMTIMIAHPSV
eukprot:791772-Rhodomonas_salina.6